MENSRTCTMDEGRNSNLPPCREKEKRCDSLMSLYERMSKHRLIGIAMSACSGIAFTLSNFMVQVAHVQISQNENNNLQVSNFQMVFIRCFIQLLFFAPFLCINRFEIYRTARDVPYLLLMGLSGCVNIILIYASLERIPISDTLLMTFTSPFFCAIFSKLFMGEGLHWINMTAGLISFTGVTIVAHPSFLFGVSKTRRNTLSQTTSLDSNNNDNNNEIVYLTGVCYALFGAVFLALYFVLVRKMISMNGVHSAVTVFYPSLIGSLTCAFVMLIAKQPVYFPKNMDEGFVLISIGVYSAMALTFLTFALKVENATVVNLIRNLDVIFAFLLQYGVFGIEPNMWNISGGMIILIATGIVVARQHFSSDDEN